MCVCAGVRGNCFCAPCVWEYVLESPENALKQRSVRCFGKIEVSCKLSLLHISPVYYSYVSSYLHKSYSGDKSYSGHCVECIFAGFHEHALNSFQKMDHLLICECQDFLKGKLNPKNMPILFRRSRLSQMKHRKRAESCYYYSHIHSNPTAALICALSSFACTDIENGENETMKPRKNIVD